MRLIINTVSLFAGGGIQVALSFISECKVYIDNEYHVFLSKSVSEQINKDEYPSNFKFYEIPHRASSFLKHKSVVRLLTKFEEDIKPDCVFTVFGPAYWKPKAKHVVGYAIPHYLYPESPLFRKMPVLDKLSLFIKKKIQCFFFKRDGDVFIVETDDVNQRLQKLLKTKNVHTVPNVTNSCYLNYRVKKNKLPEREQNEIRLLTVSAFYAHKNLEIIKKVVHILKKKQILNVKFILTIDHLKYKEVFGEEYLDFIKTVGPVIVEDCPSLYAECDFMFLPTLLECFSASYPEAMMMNKPIITSDLGFARTVCKDAAIYFNPLDAEDIVSKLIILINDSDKQLDLVKKGKDRLKDFGSANVRAMNYLEICNKTIRK